MKLTDLIGRKAIVADIKSTDKRGAIKELVAAVKTAYAIPKFKPDVVVEAMMEREKQSSTGIGGGVAVPHARTDLVRTAVGALGRSPKGIDFAAVDGEPVHVIFLILSPSAHPEEYQRAVKRVMEAIRTPNFTRFLRGARTVKEIEETLRETEDLLIKVQ